MEIILGIDRITKPFVNPVVTLGNFDGVHLGHQKIFERVTAEASKIGGEAIVITFEPHPLRILSPDRCPPLLASFRKKMMLIEASGIQKVLCIEFSRSFSELSPFEFVKEILVEKVKARKVIVGYNYHFGSGKKGDVQGLMDMAGQFNVDVEVVPPLKIGDTVVSSSKIRQLLKGGRVEDASRLLGRDYLVVGRVVEGARRGRTLGFPTANLEISDELYPKEGVYAVQVTWRRRTFNGLANVGFNPTFLTAEGGTKGQFSLEVHILDFDGDIYGEEIQVHFRRRIRDELRFNSASLLVDRIKKDIEWAKENVFKER